ncbi:MAG: response regulator [Defluviitaleaceae bacterium]|nr:response regulator [Defluviitaleaceae bacterium]
MRKTIFIVDDSDTNLTQAEEVLEDHYTVITMSSAEKMFHLIDKKTPNLILLDIEMPEMDGLEAMERLQADNRLSAIPVIFLTGQREAATETRCFEMGAADFIGKPFTAPGLLRRVKTQLCLRELLSKYLSERKCR